MYKEITIDPACMAEFEYYTLLKTSFGFEKGRYLTVSIREWVAQAVKAIKASNMSDIKQSSVKNFLNQLQRDKRNTYALLSFERRNIAEEQVSNWFDWQQKQNVEKPFSAVVSDFPIENSISHMDILDDHEKWHLSPTIQTKKTPEEIYQVLKPIVEISRVITIVDPYFSLASNGVLRKLIAECQNNLALKSIKLVTAINTANPEKVFEREYLSEFDNVPSFELIVVNNSKQFHDRYLYSDSAGIKAGHGFSEAAEKGAQSDLLSFNLVGTNEINNIGEWVLKLIASGNAEYKMLHNRDV
jgi:hypothetical protein